jgi:inhibitor of cysteine peptidase
LAEIDLDGNVTGRSIAARPGDVLILRLEETPTSGYRWELDDHDPGVLAPAGDEFSPDSGDTMGGGGIRRFRFTVVGPGISPLKLVRRRPWAADSVVEAFEATVDATG